MKRASNRHQLRLITEISVTPLLDLVFVLLLVFMVTAPLLNNEAALLLPAAASSKTGETPPAEFAELSLDSEQNLRLEGAAITRADLPAALAKLAKDRKDVGVAVRIHRDLPVQRLVELMDLLRDAGVQKTSVMTMSSPGS